MHPNIRKRIVKPPASRMPPHGVYVHSSPPRVLPMNPSQIRQWLRSGDLERLEQIVLEGQGNRLVGEYSPEARVRSFLKTIPTFMAKSDAVHDAVAKGSLSELQELLIGDSQRRKLVMCKDPTGVGILHKAVYFDYPDIVRWLVGHYPALVQAKDKEGRTALHYCGACKDPGNMTATLVSAGADRGALDSRLHTPAYYLEHPGEAELPDPLIVTRTVRRFTDGKDGLVIKPSNVRIWIHDRDLGRLQQVVWEGHGGKLRTETSSNPRVRKFLEAVPHIMGCIRDIHTSAINNNFEQLANKTADPVPPVVLSSKDANGLTALHKAAGLGHTDIVEYILEQYPDSATIADNEGRTALHYAASMKDNSRVYNLLVQAGSDQAKLDNKFKAPGYYKTRPMDIDRTLLTVVPEAPRTATEAFPAAWDWGILSAGAMELLAKGTKKLLNKPPPPDVEVFNNASEYIPKNKHVNKIEEKPIRQPSVEPEQKTDPEPEAAATNGTIMSPDPETNIDEFKVEEEEYQPKEKETSPEDSPKRNVLSDIEKSPEISRQNSIEKNEDANIGQVYNADEEPDPEQMVDEYDPELDFDEVGKADTADVLDVEREKEALIAANSMDDGLLYDNDPDDDDVIEGVVHGSPDEAKLKSESMERDDVDQLNFDAESTNSIAGNLADPEVQALVEAGDMESLAGLVLNGEGHRLIGQNSNQPELQAFLDNVPAYMNKIRRVHVAAREGSLRDLQGALDRRKFATARDITSPNGASPLHVATLFGHTSIVRYLAGRFPETTLAVDDNGRTPLHYAAVISDNGHFYNLLQHLGADTKAEDKLGNTAEFYRNNNGELSHKDLLREFGAEEQFVDNILNDQDLLSNNQVEIPLFRTEEGRYLATSLGDPLIKGLTEVANKRPKDPIAFLATFLYNFANQNKSRVKTQESQVLITGDHEGANDNSAPPVIDVVALEEQGGFNTPDGPEAAFSSEERDEHGQSMVHFAAARSHGRGALFQLLEESGISIAYRDELYRTARDVSLQAGLPENATQIDRFVVHLAARGDTKKVTELVTEGYDHITDIVDEEDGSIMDIVSKRGMADMMELLFTIKEFEERREQLHQAIRQGDSQALKQILTSTQDSGMLVCAKNAFGRCALHIAILKQDEEIAETIANSYAQSLRVGDNLERTALHYAMGVDKVESLSRILIKAGAKRVLKDLKGRQASYYFMNKTDILRLQEEEETY